MSWNINGSSDMAQPWLQSDGDSRPYLYSQKAAISNDVGDPLTKELTTYVTTNESFTSRGARYSKVSTPTDWIEIVSPYKSKGKDVIELDDLQDDTLYYVQSYVKIGIEAFYGEQVSYSVYTANTPPTAEDVHIDGGFASGEILEGKYMYRSLSNTPETGSTYKWYLSDNASGNNKMELLIQWMFTLRLMTRHI